MTTEEYIEKYKDVAIKKMKEYHIPASITLAQGILESGSGNSRLARKANNHFGIKCHKDWNGKKFYMDDDERHECFRKYHNPAESYRDHSLFLTQKGRYAFLFDYDITDYKSWAYGLKKAGYATNPKYPKLLIGIIERYNLSQYDTGGKKGKKRKDKIENADGEIASTAFPDLSHLKPVSVSNSGRDIFEKTEWLLSLQKQVTTTLRWRKSLTFIRGNYTNTTKRPSHTKCRPANPFTSKRKRKKRKRNTKPTL